MPSSQTGNAIGSEDRMNEPGIEIHIIGPQHFQNSLMATVLNKELRIPCYCGDSIGSSLRASNKRLLVLIDAQGHDDLDHLFETLEQLAGDRDSVCMIALFNFPREKAIDRQKIFATGIRGVFIENDSPDLFLKGIREIFNSKHWFSRNLLNQWVFEMGATGVPGEESPMLTPREKQILEMVSTGASNEEISEELAVSYHTVKAHLSKIYKKLRVSNRLSASLWASKNL